MSKKKHSSEFWSVIIFSYLCLILIKIFVVKVAAVEQDPQDSSLPYIFLSTQNIQDIKPNKAPTILRSRLVKLDMSFLSDPKEDFIAEPDSEIPLI